ncbi:RNA 2',3'-cyclic phosphodiesterase [Roseiarcaceae bacterium H3SJ34-1]|uniref:RNA 2',3'-cyclic phosphodiesterase n=1 Tax=Terripilifer ovatus TaxID=3032367 RepID=UPI003AB95F7E|nr:RNA 2',3'-cyclic phosphodiesterase [Roseiarcaceae bacterium H3SJ34-1]
MPRLFTGLELPDDLTDDLALLRGGLVGARWIEPEDYHLTLRFIGDIGDAQANEVYDKLQSIRRPSFTVTLDGLASFGGEKPRAIVARAQPSRELLELQGEHERAMRRIGLMPESRKFTPHVTIARLRNTSVGAVADWLGTRALLPKQFTVTNFVLFSSRASTGGGPYVSEASFQLDRSALRVGYPAAGDQPVNRAR